MGSNLIGELVANNGTYFLNVGARYVGNVDQVIVRGNGITDIELFITIDGELLEVTEDYLGDLRLPDGLRITPKGDDVFTNVRCNDSETPGVGLELVLSA